MGAPTLGRIFYHRASVPLFSAFGYLRGKNTRGALQVAHYSHLEQAFVAAVDEASAAAGVPRDDVSVLLPDARMQEAAAATMESYQQAVEVFEQHEGLLGKAIHVGAAAVELHFNVLRSGVGEQAASILNELVHGGRLRGPIAEWGVKLAVYDEWLRWCGRMIDDDVRLKEAYEKRLRRRRVMKLVRNAALLAVLGVGGWFGVHAYMQATSTTPSASPARPAPPSASAPAALAGTWRDADGIVFEASEENGAYFFKVHDASQLPRSGLHDGDVRFVLAPAQWDERAFTVEDHVRPVPPKGIEYAYDMDPSACRETWTGVDGTRLAAHLEGPKLTIDVVKLDLNWSTLKVVSSKVVGCQALRSLPVTRGQIVLERN